MADDDLDPRGRCTNCRRLLPIAPGGMLARGLCPRCAEVPPPEDLPRGFAGRPAGRALLDLVEACERLTTSAEGHDDPAYRQLGHDLQVATSTWRREKRLPTNREVWRALSTIAGGVVDGVVGGPSTTRERSDMTAALTAGVDAMNVADPDDDDGA